VTHVCVIPSHFLQLGDFSCLAYLYRFELFRFLVLHLNSYINSQEMKEYTPPIACGVYSYI